MTRYNDPVEEGWYGDFDEQMHDQLVTGYREGVDRVLTYIKSLNPQADTPYYGLLSELRWAIKEGII